MRSRDRMFGSLSVCPSSFGLFVCSGHFQGLSIHLRSRLGEKVAYLWSAIDLHEQRRGSKNTCFDIMLNVALQCNDRTFSVQKSARVHTHSGDCGASLQYVQRIKVIKILLTNFFSKQATLYPSVMIFLSQQSTRVVTVVMDAPCGVFYTWHCL